MEAEDFISKELQSTTDLNKFYASTMAQLQQFSKDKPEEVARLTSALSRGMRRLDKDNKRLNKQLSSCLEMKDQE